MENYYVILFVSISETWLKSASLSNGENQSNIFMPEMQQYGGGLNINSFGVQEVF